MDLPHCSSWHQEHEGFQEHDDSQEHPASSESTPNNNFRWAQGFITPGTFGMTIKSLESLLYDSPIKKVTALAIKEGSRMAYDEYLRWTKSLKNEGECGRVADRIKRLQRQVRVDMERTEFTALQKEINGYWKFTLNHQNNIQDAMEDDLCTWFANDLKGRFSFQIQHGSMPKFSQDDIHKRFDKFVNPLKLHNRYGSMKKRIFLHNATRRIKYHLGSDFMETPEEAVERCKKFSQKKKVSRQLEAANNREKERERQIQNKRKKEEQKQSMENKKKKEVEEQSMENMKKKEDEEQSTENTKKKEDEEQSMENNKKKEDEEQSMKNNKEKEDEEQSMENKKKNEDEEQSMENKKKNEEEQSVENKKEKEDQDGSVEKKRKEEEEQQQSGGNEEQQRSGENPIKRKRNRGKRKRKQRKRPPPEPLAPPAPPASLAPLAPPAPPAFEQSIDKSEAHPLILTALTDFKSLCCTSEPGNVKTTGVLPESVTFKSSQKTGNDAMDAFMVEFEASFDLDQMLDSVCDFSDDHSYSSSIFSRYIRSGNNLNATISSGKECPYFLDLSDPETFGVFQGAFVEAATKFYAKKG